MGFVQMQADALSLTFSALADPTRRAILARLASGERSVQELAKPFDMSLPAVSKHLKVLERAGLIDDLEVSGIEPILISSSNPSWRNISQVRRDRPIAFG